MFRFLGEHNVRPDDIHIKAIWFLFTDLHEARDAHYGLVGLVEHLPPGEGAARRPGVIRLPWQEVGDVGHGPVGVGQLSVEKAGGDVVL